MFRLACLAIGYAFGCIQIAYFAGRLVAKIDIREHGSGNAGTTNVTRVMGKRAGIIVFVLDVLKGMLAFNICMLLYGGTDIWARTGQILLPALYGGLGAVLGHCFPFYLKFAGGKGMATALGVIFWIHGAIAAIAYTAGVVTVAAKRYISLASLVIIGLLPILTLIFFSMGEHFWVTLAMTAIIYYRHRGNIERLIKGNERKFTFKGGG